MQTKWGEISDFPPRCRKCNKICFQKKVGPNLCWCSFLCRISIFPSAFHLIFLSSQSKIFLHLPHNISSPSNIHQFALHFIFVGRPQLILLCQLLNSLFWVDWLGSGAGRVDGSKDDEERRESHSSYLSKSKNVFVWIWKCICLNFRISLSKCWNVFV